MPYSMFGLALRARAVPRRANSALECEGSVYGWQKSDITWSQPISAKNAASTSSCPSEPGSPQQFRNPGDV